MLYHALKYWIELSKSKHVVQNERIRCSKWNYDVRTYWTEHSELNSEGLLSWIEYSKLCSVSKTLNWTLWMWLWSFIILIKHFKLCYKVQIKMNWMFQFNIPNGINNSTNYRIKHSKHYSHAHLRCWIKCSIWKLQMQLWCPNTE